MKRTSKSTGSTAPKGKHSSDSTSPLEKRTAVKKSANRALLYGIALSIPILFFVLIELVLRFIGFGQSTPLFITNPANPAYSLARPDVMNRYFPFSAHKPNVTMETDFFLAQKPENGLRIVVQGGSTAAGFPYGLGASLSGLLEQRLRQSWPEHHVEVINTAMSAVNSHTLLDLSDEIIALQPDMILIYAGHNEFLGILGASSNFTSSNSYWFTRVKIALKDYRLFQLMQYLYASFQSYGQHNKALKNSNNSINSMTNESRGTMMAQVAKNQNIQMDSPVYKQGLQQFESNMRALLAKYQAAGVPVFIAKIASNYKDQSPLKSIEQTKEERELINNIEAFVTQDGAQNSQQLSSELARASDKLTSSQSAKTHFEFAHLSESLAHKQQASESTDALYLAQKHYELAIAHDLLKFRAPVAINQAIETLASEFDATMVDTLSDLQARSRNKIVGSELMLEHLHPNLQGYFVIAESFYQAISKTQIAAPWLTISANQAWRERLILPSEEYYGFAMVQKLKADYPFQTSPQALRLPKPTDKTQALGFEYFSGKIDWITMMEQNLEYYRQSKNTEMMAKTVQILADAMPHDARYNLSAAQALELEQKWALAIHYYSRSKLAGLVQPNADERIALIKAKQKNQLN